MAAENHTFTTDDVIVSGRAQIGLANLPREDLLPLLKQHLEYEYYAAQQAAADARGELRHGDRDELSEEYLNRRIYWTEKVMTCLRVQLKKLDEIEQIENIKHEEQGNE